ncbi:MAG: YggT family protein [Candidatus Makana argininalis]
MIIINFLVKSIIDFYIILIIIRIWIQWTKCDFYNSFYQLIDKITYPLIKIIKYLMPNYVNTCFFIISIFLAIVKFPIIIFFETNLIKIKTIYIVIGIITLLKIFGNLLFWILILRLLLIKLKQDKNIMNEVIYMLSESLIFLIKKIFPSTYSIDLSFLILISFLFALNYLGIYLLPGVWYRI